MTIEQIIGWVVALGIPTGFTTFIWRKVKGLHNDNKAVKEGVQALLRSKMIDDYNHYMEKGYAPIYAKENFHNMYMRYHALGVNGVMDRIHDEFMSLPTSRENRILQKEE